MLGAHTRVTGTAGWLWLLRTGTLWYLVDRIRSEVGTGWDVCSLLLAAATAAALFLLGGWLKAVRAVLRLPGPPALPLLGNVLLITDHAGLVQLGKNSYQEYGTLYRVWIAMFPMVVVQAPGDVQAILGSPKHTEKISLYRLLHNFLGEGLITSSGDRWRVHRRLVQPSFHVSILEEYVATFATCAEALVGKLTATGPEGVNIATHVNECVLDVLNEAVLGIPVSSKLAGELQRDSPFRKGQVVVPYRMVRPWLLFSWVYKLTDLAKREMQQKDNLVQFTKKILAERRLQRRKVDEHQQEFGRPKPSKCLMDHMIAIAEKNAAFTDEDIVNEICTFMLAGQDSVGAAVAFTLLMLAKHPEAQQRVVAELEAIFGQSNRPPSRQDLHNMRYLEQCLKETLRLYPSVPIIARRLGEDVCMGKHTLPAGCEVVISPFSIHRLPHVYPNPEAFDPSRFSPENVEGRNPYAFIPFSAGPRNCIGYKFALMEMKTLVSTLLRSFRLDTVAGKESVSLTYRITLRSKGGVWLRLAPQPDTGLRVQT